MRLSLWTYLFGRSATAKTRRAARKSRYGARLILETLETRLTPTTPATLSWIGGDAADPTGWNDANNWRNASSAPELPANGDILVFDNTTVGFTNLYGANNDFPAGLIVGGIVIHDTDTTAGNNFTLGGVAIILQGGGGITHSMTAATADVAPANATLISLVGIQLGDTEVITNNKVASGAVTGSNLLITSSIDLSGHSLSYASNGTVLTGTPTDTTTRVTSALVDSNATPTTDSLNSTGSGLTLLNYTPPTLAPLLYAGNTNVSGGGTVAVAQNGDLAGGTTLATVSGLGSYLAFVGGVTYAAAQNVTLTAGGGIGTGDGTTDSFAGPITVGAGGGLVGAITGTFIQTGAIGLGANNLAIVGAGTTYLDGIIAGTGTVIMGGTGTAVLGNAANAYTNTIINSGILAPGDNGALGSATGGITIVNSGGALGFAGGITYNDPETVNLAGSGPGGNGSIQNVSGANAFNGASDIINTSGDTTLGANAGILLINSNFSLGASNLFLAGSTSAGQLILSGNISGNNVTEKGPATATLSGTNSFTGTASILGGALVAGSNGALNGTASITVSRQGALGLANNITLSGSEAVSITGIGAFGLGAIESVSGTNILSLPINVTGFAGIGADSGSTLMLSGSTINLGSGELATTGAGQTNIVDPIINGNPSNSTPQAFVGFTGGDGGAVSQIRINDWSYVSGATNINYGAGFSASGLTLNGNASLQGTQLQLTSGAVAGNERSSAWATTSADVSTLSTAFDFTFGSTIAPAADGFTFTVQNIGPNALGGSAGGLGYGANGGQLPILSSYAIEFNLYNGNSQMGLGINGSLDTNTLIGGSPAAPGVNVAALYGINFHTNPNDNYRVVATLNGNTFTATLTDTTTTSTTGAITFTVPAQIGALNQIGSGTTSLSGANTYTGPTQILQGTLVAGSNSALSNNFVTVASGGALALGATGSITLAAGAPLTIAGTGPTGNGAIESLGGNNIIAGNVTLSANATIGSDAGTLALTGTSINMGIFALTTTGSGNISIANQITNSSPAPTLAFVGFTGATGGVSATQNLLDWTYSSGATNILFTSFPATATGLTLNGNTQLGSTGNNYMQLTNGCNNQDSSAWWQSQVPVSTFSTSFDFNFVGTSPSGVGFTFCVQNSPAGTSALGAGGGSLGYQGIAPSFAIGLVLYPGVSELVLGVGGRLYAFGPPGPPPFPPPDVDVTTKGINFHSGSTDLYNISATYDTLYLVTTITDRTKGVSFTTTFAVSLTANIGTVTKNGTGSLTLSNNSNSYTGQTTINNGVLVTSALNALGAVSGFANGTTVNGGTLAITGGISLAEQNIDLNGNGFNNQGGIESLSDGNSLTSTINPIQDSSIVSTTGTLTLGGTVSGSGFNLIVDGAGNTNAVGLLGAVANSSGGLIKQGTGTLDLTLPGFTNNFNGNVTLNGGVTKVSSDAQLGSNLTNMVQVGAATLDVTESMSSTRSLSFTGAGVLQVDAGTLTDSASVGSSSGSLTKIGPGSLALSGASSFGGLTITQGTVALSGLASLGSGTVNMNGGTLAFQGVVQKNSTPLILNTFSSFNADVIWGLTEANPLVGSTRAFDGVTVGNMFYEKGVPVSLPSTGLPNYQQTQGKFTSSVNGLTTFQLQPYTGPNILLLSSNQSGSVVLTTPTPYQTIAIADTAGNGTNTYTIRLNFADGGTRTFTGLVAQDWFAAQSTSPKSSLYPIALGQFGRVSRATTGLTYSGISSGTLGTAPFLYEQDVTLTTSDQTRTLTSITFTNNNAGNGTLGIMAVSGLVFPTPINYTNALTLSQNSTVDVSGQQANSKTLVGPLTAGNNTLTVTGGGNQSFRFSGVTLTGNPNFNAGTGSTITLGGLNDGGTARTINLNGPGGFNVASVAAGVVNGTTVNVTAGASLTLSAGGALGTLAAVNLPAGTTLSLATNTGSVLGSSSNTLGSLNGGGIITLNAGTLIPDGNTLTIGSTNNLNSVVSGNIADGNSAGKLSTAGTGTVTLSGNDTYTGATTVGAGSTLLVDGSVSASVVTVAAGGILGGNGTITLAVLASGGTISPGHSPGLLNVGGITLNSASTYVEQIGGTTAGTSGYDQLAVQATGSVVLNNAVLNLSVVNGFQPLPGQGFVIVSYTGSTLTGTFNGLAQNAFVTANGYKFQVSYTGTPAGAASGGHSIVLTVQTPGPATHFTVTASPSSVTAGTGVSVTVTALDANNLVATAFNATNVTFGSSDAQAVFASNNLPLTPNGQTTFFATLKTAGGLAGASANQTITAIASGIPLATSNTVTVNPGTFTNFAVAETTPAQPLPAGQSFVYEVAPADAFGNFITGTNFNGAVNFTTTDPGVPTLPSQTITNGNPGYYLGTFFTAGSRTITATSGAVSGTSAGISVAAAAANHFVITPTITNPQDPAVAITGTSFPTTVTVKDAFNNAVTGYTGTVTLTGTDGAMLVAGGNTFNFTGANGVHTFTITLNTAGNNTITVSDAPDNLASVSSAITTRGLIVYSTTPTSTGFVIQFSKPVKLLNGTTPLVNIYDVSESSPINGPLLGSLVFSNNNQTANFVVTNFEPTDDAFTLDLTSKTAAPPANAAAGFQDESGVPLDGGNNAGTSDYVTSWTTTFNSQLAVFVPGFARGPGQPVNIDVVNFNNAASTAGIPVQLGNNDQSATINFNATSVTFTMSYNANWLTISNVTNVASPAGGTYSVATAGSGANATASFTWSKGTALSIPTGSGYTTIGKFSATVPSAAAYKSKGVLNLGTPTVLNGASTVSSVGQNGVQAVVFLGDASGIGSYNPLNASQMSTFQNTGALFGSFPLADPALIAGVDGAVDPNSISQVLQFNLNKPVPGIPSAAGLTPPSNNPAGPDPALAVGSGQWAVGSGRVTVPVNIDDPHPAGSTGLTEAMLALRYDPKVLRLSAQDIHLGTVPLSGTGWALQSTVDAVTGQIGIVIYSLTPIRTAEAGSLVTLDFHVLAGAPAGLSPIQLVAAANPNGQVFQTFLADTQSILTLHQPPPSRFLPGLDGQGVATATYFASAAKEVLPSAEVNSRAAEAPAETAGPALLPSAPEENDVLDSGMALAHSAALLVPLAVYLTGPGAGASVSVTMWAGLPAGALAGMAASPAAQRLVGLVLAEQAHRLAYSLGPNNLEALLWDAADVGADWLADPAGGAPSAANAPAAVDYPAVEEYFAQAGDELE